MERIKLLQKEEASQEAQKTLDELTQGGKVINIFKAMANSAAVLKAYAGMSSALANKTLDTKIVESIGVQIAYLNQCQYCQAAHSYLAKSVLSEREISLAREGKSDDPDVQAALDFAASVMKNAGRVSDEEFENVKKAGFSDGEILEIVAFVTVNFYTNAINNVSQTRVDFPKP